MFNLLILHIMVIVSYHSKQRNKVTGPHPLDLHGCPHYVHTRLGIHCPIYTIYNSI